jgi:hypothetical protein
VTVARFFRLIAALLLALCLLPAGAWAHALSFSKAELRVAKAGEATLTLRLDLRRLLTGSEPGDLTEAQFEALFGAETAERAGLRVEAEGGLSRAVLLYFSGRQLPVTVTLPEVAPAAESEAEVVLRATVPAGQGGLGLRTSEMLGTVALSAWVDEVQVMDRVPVAPGRTPEPIAVSVEEESGARTGLRYLWQGVLHIVPLGLDHILFVLALALLSLRWRPAVLQATAFTVAHSITLALAVTGAVALPASVVEPLIALSIAVVALENLVSIEARWWRLGLVFSFGLLHGLGFAGVLQELGLPDERLAVALLSFNVGVELAQVAIVAVAFGVAAMWQRSGLLAEVPMRKRLSLGIAAVGLFWTVERLLAG